MNSQVDAGTLPNFHNFFFDIFLCLGHDLFDTCRMNTSILYQAVK